MYINWSENFQNKTNRTCLHFTKNGVHASVVLEIIKS
jgi:hypothetical protein